MIRIFLLIGLLAANLLAMNLPADIRTLYPAREISRLEPVLNQVEKEGLPPEYFFNKIRQAHLKNVPVVVLEKKLRNDLETMKEARALLTRASVNGEKIQDYSASLIFLTELLQRGLPPVEFLYFLNQNKSLRKIPVDEVLNFLEQQINLEQLGGFSRETSQTITSNFYQYHQNYQPLLNAIKKILEYNLTVEHHPSITDQLEKFSRKEISWRQFLQELKQLSRQSMITEIKK